jgi:nicotinate-nucleotide--dimethylbenzimidazole phosphoribosyltransferase
MEKGKEIVNWIHVKNCNCLGFGEMGIGNTSAAALIMSVVTGLEVEECTGRGTGADEAQLETKIRTLKKVHDIHQLSKLRNQPTRLLSKVGGFEIAMMAGAFLKAAELNMVIVVDGFIATSALLIAWDFEDRVLENCIFAHTSGERGHEKMLAFLGARPLLNLGMRLGEGTGAALAIPLIQSAVNFLEKMASFESAGVSKKN